MIFTYTTQGGLQDSEDLTLEAAAKIPKPDPHVRDHYDYTMQCLGYAEVDLLGSEEHDNYLKVWKLREPGEYPEDGEARVASREQKYGSLPGYVVELSHSNQSVEIYPEKASDMIALETWLAPLLIARHLWVFDQLLRVDK